MPAGHPTDEALQDYSERGPSAGEAAATEAHLRDGCPRCDRRMAQYREVFCSLCVGSLEAAPEETLSAAMGRIRGLEEERGRSRIRERIGSAANRAVEQVRLTLVLDSRQSPALQGIRGAAEPAIRQLLFESPQASVHLRISRTRKKSFCIAGLFAPSDGVIDPSAEVVLEGAGGDTDIARKRVSSGGTFLFASVAPGSMRVRVDLPERSFRSDPLRFEEDEDA